jgi:hypothetical protein
LQSAAVSKAAIFSHFRNGALVFIRSPGGTTGGDSKYQATAASAAE